MKVSLQFIVDIIVSTFVFSCVSSSHELLLLLKLLYKVLYNNKDLCYQIV